MLVDTAPVNGVDTRKIEDLFLIFNRNNNDMEFKKVWTPTHKEVVMAEHSAEIKELEGEALSVTEHSEAIVIQSQGDIETATDYIRTIKALAKKVKDTFDPICEATNKAHKEATAARKAHTDPLSAAEGLVKGKIGRYMDECDRKRLAEEEAARQVAVKEQERKLKAVKVQIDKLVAKGGNLQEQITRLEDEAKDPELTEVEEAAYAARIEILKAQVEGNAEKVAEKTAAAVMPTYVPPIAHTAPAPKVKGLSSTVKKIGTVTDPIALIKAVADGKMNIPVSVLTFDMKAINRLLNAGMNLPGVSSKDDRVMAVR